MKVLLRPDDDFVTALPCSPWGWPHSPKEWAFFTAWAARYN
jgi:hypothetical protein